MKNPWRFIMLAGKAFSAICLVFLGLWLLVIYPNDFRIGDPPEFFVKEASADQWVVKRRLFGGDLSWEHSVSLESYRGSIDALRSRLPRSFDDASPRFRSPYQLYLPVGHYPFRLDGRDVILIPKGQSIQIRPDIDGTSRLAFGLYALGDGAELVVSTPRESKRFVIQQSSNRNLELSGMDLFLKKFITVDLQGGVDIPAWEDAKFDVELSRNMKVELRCESDVDDCFVSEPSFSTKTNPKMNGVLIVVDTLRADQVTSSLTPALFALKEQGVSFEQAIATGNMTSPSTNGLLSCRLPTKLGSLAFSYGVSAEERHNYYRSTKKSFPSVIAANGYVTSMIGSVSVLSEAYGVGIYHGFEQQIAIETDGFDTAQIAREAVLWLREHRDQRFFLYIHLNAPHAAYRPPLRDIVSTWKDYGSFRSYGDILRWLYAGEVSYSDRYVQRILRELGNLGLGSQTVVAMTSDHGDQMTPRIFANNELGPDFEGRYFDHGATLFQDEISIPLIFLSPDGPMGKRVPEFVSNLDVGPTFLHLLGLGSKDDCDGRSLAGYLGLGVPPPADRVIASEGFQARSIIFGGRFKYIRSYEPTNKKIYSRDFLASRPTLYFQKEQLYDLRDDPQENRNLVTINSALLREARRLYKDAFRVVSGFELVIQTPKDSPIEVKMPEDLAPRIREGQGTVQVENGYWIFSSGSSSLVLLALHKPDPDLIEVSVNGAQIPLRYTSMRLPLLEELDHLPAEPGGEQSLVPYPVYASAFLRRIEDREKDDRRVISSNPEFDRVLREWGYLNDQ